MIAQQMYRPIINSCKMPALLKLALLYYNQRKNSPLIGFYGTIIIVPVHIITPGYGHTCISKH